MATTAFVFHPNFAASTVNARLAAEAEKQDGVTVRRLYDLYPDFRIDVAAEQAALTASDRIVLQFPMYWYSCPPLLKKWEDDVLTYGWAYGPTGDALHGKEMVVAVSPGAPVAASRRTRLRVPRAEDHAPYACGHDRPRAHRARLERDVQVAVRQPPVAHGGGGAPQRRDLGVPGGVVFCLPRVVSATDRLPLPHDERADRHIPRGLG